MYFCLSFLLHAIQLRRVFRVIKLGPVHTSHCCRVEYNAIQTKDNEANHLIIYSLNYIRHGRNATYEPGLRTNVFFDGSRKLERKLLLDTGTMANGNSC